MAPEQDPGEVAAGVAADDQDHEQQRPVRALRLRQHQRDERSHRRQVDQREDASGDVTDVAADPAGKPPGEHGDEGDGQRGHHVPRPLPVGKREHQRAADGDRDDRDQCLLGGQDVPEFGHGQADDDRDQDEERDRQGQQREDDQTAEADADRDRDRKIAAGVDRLALAHAARPPLGRLASPRTLMPDSGAF